MEPNWDEITDMIAKHLVEKMRKEEKKEEKEKICKCHCHDEKEFVKESEDYQQGIEKLVGKEVKDTVIKTSSILETGMVGIIIAPDKMGPFNHDIDIEELKDQFAMSLPGTTIVMIDKTIGDSQHMVHVIKTDYADQECKETDDKDNEDIENVEKECYPIPCSIEKLDSSIGETLNAMIKGDSDNISWELRISAK